MSDVLDRLAAALADRYAIEREIGSGGMATVYLAEDLKHHRKVAVKVLRPELAATLGPERFLREIEVAARLQHPHILPLHDSGEAGGFLYYVMPYVEGQSLREKLVEEGELPIDEAVRVIKEVVDALAHAHEHGVVHRDIKPDNIMLSGRHAMVTDFGVAKAVSEATGRQQLTTAGVALGTPAYMAPEQAAAEDHIDHRADIYAIGAMAYELLAGRPPFTGNTSQAILGAHVTETPEPVTKHREAVPPALEQLVMKCLEKKPADRWQSAEAMLPQLEAMATPSGGMTPTGTLPAAPARAPVPRNLIGAVAAAVLVVAGGWWIASGRGDSTVSMATDGDRIRVAVISFENLTGDPEDEYFSDGITQDINTQLARVEDFSVVAHGSSKQYTSAEAGYAEIAATLDADYVVDGSVRRAGGRVLITVSLIDPATSDQVWADRYDQEFSAPNVFEIQRSVARQVADALSARFAGDDEASALAPPTEETEALNAYLLGRFHWQKRTGPDLELAIEHFTRAIELDSGYAIAYSGLADSYSFLPWYGRGLPHDAYPKAREAALTALRLDSTLAEAHASLGLIQWHYDWDWTGGAASLERAMELRPQYAIAHAWYASYLITVGQVEDGLAEMRRALELDPLSSNVHGNLGRGLFAARRFSEAIAAYRQANQLSGNPNVDIGLSLAYLANGDRGAGQAHAEGLDLGSQAMWYGATGDEARARELLAQVTASADSVRVLPWSFAQIHVAIGDMDGTFLWLERAFDERAPQLAWHFFRMPLWDRARRDPRFADLMRRMGLDADGWPLEGRVP
ncbi:MAG: protein kinase [Gemmatimonadetes bacterium]|nr:protein kinase [Gemmatimonadota bacterium]